MVQHSARAQSDRVVTRYIEQEMRESFIDYSMSVIVQRALPDARDGLKPVHRRILYAMYQLGLRPDRGYKKSATVVGDVLGKYHPHGDSAVYDTIVRMVQDFSLRYPLVDGQGNFGSVDGDSAAAYRYTEVKLAPISLELLQDLEYDTVDFRDNFDGRLQEPEVLPTRLPQLLLNGTDGIAVGMATKIPPHNLTELLDATDHLVQHPDCDVEELMARLPGPDFPTGGYIWGREGIRNAYETGRGLVEMRARMHVEEGNYGKKSIVVTELPYQVNKSRVIEQITRMVRRGRTDAITDLRDESDRDGIRLVIELKRDVEPRTLLEKLFKKTQLRYTFGVINLALVDGKPEEMDLKQSLECFVDHRLEVIERRARDRLEQARDRAHVVEGLLVALDDIDRVIQLIRESATPRAASNRLQAEMELTEPQAEAILAMRLARLTGLESDKLRDELAELEEAIAEYTELVEKDEVRRGYLRRELAELSDRYGDPRRTEILDDDDEFPLPSGDGAEANLVLLTHRGYIKAQPVRGGGMAGAEAVASREGDFVRQAFMCRGSAEILFVTRGGNVHSLQVGDLPRGTRSSRGRPLSEFLQLEERDEVVAALPVREEDEDGYLLTVTRGGKVKRTELSEYENVRSGGIIGAGLSGDDEILGAFVTDGTEQVVIATRDGQAIRFEESEIRSMGRSAKGVKGIELSGDDHVVAAAAPHRDAELLVATRRGYAKRVPFTELRLQGRAGKGTTLLPERNETGNLVGVLEVSSGDRIMWEQAGGSFTAADVDEAVAKARNEAGLRMLDLTRDEPPVVAVHPLRTGSTAGSAATETGPESAEEEDAAGGEDAPERLAGAAADDAGEAEAGAEEAGAEEAGAGEAGAGEAEAGAGEAEADSEEEQAELEL